MKKTMLLIVSAVLICNMAHADVPKTINFQGEITDINDQPLAEGQYIVTFKLYEGIESIEEVWKEVQTLVVDEGMFSTTLGNETPLDEELFEKPLWVGIQVGTEQEMAPRIELRSTPYALKAASLTFEADLPIGTIVAWHKSLPRTPDELPLLPEKWVECNGQTIKDKESKFIGQVVPNLNGDPDGAMMPGFDTPETFFLRGGLESGNVQWDALQEHGHDTDACHVWDHDNGLDLGSAFRAAWKAAYIGQVIGDDVRVDTETRPKNMSVVWIMKIK